MRIAICEDEKVVLDFESSLVTQWAAGAGCPLELDTYISAEQFLFESEDKAPYDVLIFDIQMKNMNGMELAKKLRARGCDAVIIFITGVPDYAIEGYEVGAVRYILKPVKAEVLNALLDTVRAERQKKAEDYFVLGQGADVERISFDKIIYIEARGHYVYLKGKGFEREWKASFSETSTAFDGRCFFCLRRGLLVNLSHVARITRTDCVLDNEEVLPVARGVYKELNEAFISFFKNN
ncbi:LytTR family DNA-binding domain-containing protein [Treponema bryantii]|uniref:LytR/AlgR family response regulator transcription factor n=1 Tax=Treponema bryantii TaxID=163 RepID=UPI002B2A8AFE|nr:DNA-binding response regulator [Treponema bryantii]